MAVSFLVLLLSHGGVCFLAHHRHHDRVENLSGHYLRHFSLHELDLRAGLIAIDLCLLHLRDNIALGGMQHGHKLLFQLLWLRAIC